MTVGRRFVAGAVCPRCGVVDRIVLEDADRRVRCVACGFTDTRPLGTPATTPLGKLDGRRDVAGETTPDTPIRVLDASDERPDSARDDSRGR